MFAPLFLSGGWRRPAAGQPVIFLVEDDPRTRRFICTVLKYSTSAVVIDGSAPRDALRLARSAERPINLLILNIDSAESGGIELVRELAARTPGLKVLLMSRRARLPFPIPAAWRFLSIAFPTAAFLDRINELCGLGEAAAAI